jgi:REP element-mobilizing transposase RayT
LNRFIYKRNSKTIPIGSLKLCQTNKGLEIFAWCFMAGYDHLIMGTPSSNMEAILRNFKSFTSKELKEAIKISA